MSGTTRTPVKRRPKKAITSAIATRVASQAPIDFPAPDHTPIDESVKRFIKRRAPFAINVTENGDGVKAIALPTGTANEELIVKTRMLDAFGTKSFPFANVALEQLEQMTRKRGGASGAEVSTTLNAGLAFVEAIRPENELEAALAVQMAGTHSLAAEMLWRARSSEFLDNTQAYVNIATKLQRTFVAQTEALLRLRGKGQQTVRVEHVTVQAGAQAIVGDVHHHRSEGAGGTSEKEDTIHAAHYSGSRVALPSPDPLGNGVPIPRDAERSMQDARRTEPWPAKGESKCS